MIHNRSEKDHSLSKELVEILDHIACDRGVNGLSYIIKDFDPVVLDIVNIKVRCGSQAITSNFDSSSQVMISDRDDETGPHTHTAWRLNSCGRGTRELKGRLITMFEASKDAGVFDEHLAPSGKGCNLSFQEEIENADAEGEVRARDIQTRKGHRKEATMMDQEKIDRVAEFMEALEGFADEFEWEDETDSCCSDETKESVEGDLGLVNLFDNTYSYTSQDDQDYTLLCSHKVCCRLFSKTESEESSSFPTIVPCSLTKDIRVNELRGLKSTSGKRKSLKQSENTNELSNVSGRGRLNEDDGYTVAEKDRTMNSLQIYRRKVGEVRRDKCLSQVDKTGVPAEAGEEGVSQCHHEDIIL